MGEHDRALFRDVLVEDDTVLAAPQQRRQCSATGKEWPLSQILTVMLQQIESVQEGHPDARGAAQFIKPGKPVRAASIARDTVRPRSVNGSAGHGRILRVNSLAQSLMTCAARRAPDIRNAAFWPSM
jgi:hypothetical protein